MKLYASWKVAQTKLKLATTDDGKNWTSVDWDDDDNPTQKLEVVEISVHETITAANHKAVQTARCDAQPHHSKHIKIRSAMIPVANKTPMSNQ